MTVEDSRKLLPAEFYSSWLTWLNHHLTKIWPYVDEAASVLIRASVEPDLEQYRPAVVASLTFSKLTLGTVAPQFTGVSIIEGDENGMTMELDMNWDGNPNIVLGIKTLVGVSLPVQFINPYELICEVL
ncbi:Synaptotagmin-5 [Raphanus sativus]|nr:Synaptotagmin-5 [Raphanus sativus]